MSKRLDEIRAGLPNTDACDTEDLIAVVRAAVQFCADHNITVDLNLVIGKRDDYRKWMNDFDALHAAIRVLDGVEER